MYLQIALWSSQWRQMLLKNNQAELKSGSAEQQLCQAGVEGIWQGTSLRLVLLCYNPSVPPKEVSLPTNPEPFTWRPCTEASPETSVHILTTACLPLPCRFPRGQAFLRGLQVLQVNSCISPEEKSIVVHCYDSPNPSCNRLNQQNTTHWQPWGSPELPWSEASNKGTGISVVPEQDKLPFIWRMFCFLTLKQLNLYTRSLRATRF